MYFDVYIDKSPERLWRWRLWDAGENLANSGQSFKTKAECLAEIDRVQECLVADIRVDPESEQFEERMRKLK